jgi:putative aminopeptidase FrvX
MHIDIGVADREEAEKLIRIGDPAVLTAEPLSFPNGRLVSRSLDNLLGSYVSLETARRVAEKGGNTASVIGCAVAQEEITLGGLRPRPGDAADLRATGQDGHPRRVRTPCQCGADRHGHIG